ncbi:Alpha/Beta hydrolase protein [Aspergillus stella-maris]|uniref:Alpha/Beta hydrolase protein n=1 Tax=Aspergillus stella-maris TaxID=1810926 RepID=UPI003CCDB6BD
MSSVRQRAHILRLKVLAKLFRTFVLTIGRLRIRTKPTPDLIENIPATSPTTQASPTLPKAPDHVIKIHVYHPPSSVDFKPATPSPVLITACGTGFITPSLGFDDSYCHFISRETNHTVLDVGYRLAPEDPSPAAIEDIVVVAKWVLSQPERFDVSRISIGGFSAGAQIATSAAVNYFPPGTFSSLVVFYPVFDAVTLYGEKKSFAEMEADAAVTGDGDGKNNNNSNKGGQKSLKPPLGGMSSVPAWAGNFMRECYLANVDLKSAGAVAMLKDPRVSPSYADVARFPARCLFVTAEYDCLGPEAEQLAKRIQDSHIDVQGEPRKVVVHRVMGCGHMFDKFVEKGSEREKRKDEALGLVVGMLRGD